MPQVLSVKDLTVAYGKNTVIDSASFDVQRQDFVCVVGANGSGKSTLIKAILGLIKPASGQINFVDIRPNSVGFLPQETRISQAFPATVLEIVLSGTLGRPGLKFFYNKSDRTRAQKSLQRLGILSLQDKSFTSLSGGQKQKVLLARALVASSDLLILDEPSNNLDHKSKKSFYRTLTNLNKSGLTIIMITHDLDADDLIGNKIFALKDGKVSVKSTKNYLRSFR